MRNTTTQRIILRKSYMIVISWAEPHCYSNKTCVKAECRLSAIILASAINLEGLYYTYPIRCQPSVGYHIFPCHNQRPCRHKTCPVCCWDLNLEKKNNTKHHKLISCNEPHDSSIVRVSRDYTLGGGVVTVCKYLWAAHQCEEQQKTYRI